MWGAWRAWLTSSSFSIFALPNWDAVGGLNEFRRSLPMSSPGK